MKLLNTILVLGSTVFFSACDKNETHCPKPKGQCVYPDQQFALSEPDTIQQLYHCGFDPFEIYEQQYDYNYPCFNPNNSDEFSFVRLNIKNGYKGELFTYNLCTQVLTKLADNVAYYSAWSSKNWIAFIGIDRKPYMIKSNGDSLTKVINLSYEFYNLYWNPLGTHLAVRFNNGFVGVINVTDFSFTQTSAAMSVFNWMNDSTLVGSTGSSNIYFRKYNIYSSVQENFFVFDNPEKHVNWVQNIQFLNNTSIVAWNSTRNFFNVTLSGSQSLIAEKGYITRLYVNTSYSNDKVLIARFDRRNINPPSTCYWGLKTNLFIMNYDGTDEKQIIFPE